MFSFDELTNEQLFEMLDHEKLDGRHISSQLSLVAGVHLLARKAEANKQAIESLRDDMRKIMDQLVISDD